MVTLDYTSTDDLFTLTAALKSGDHCHVLSNDYYRQYYYIIGDPESFIKSERTSKVLVACDANEPRFLFGSTAMLK